MNSPEQSLDPEAVFRLLCAEPINLGRTLDSFRSLRAGADDDLNARIDRAMIIRLGTQQQLMREIRGEVDGLKELIEKLSAPPYFLARFRRLVMLDQKRTAEVMHSRAVRVVRIADDLDPDTLVAGDQVYLSHELNVVLSRVEQIGPPVGELSTVDRIMKDGRLVVRDHDTEVVITPGGVLGDAELKAGDEVLWDRDASMALAKLDRPDSETADLLHEIGEMPPEQLAGYDEVRDSTLRRFVQGVLHPDIASRYGLDGRVDRLLLTGPPGTGKTTMMKNVAASVARGSGKRCRYRIVNGAELASPWVGETERNIQRVFTELGEHDGPAILFFDEIDAIGRGRGQPMGWHDDRALATLLACLDGMRPGGSPIVIAATNRAESLDPALRSRFSSEIEIPRPRMESARAILNVHLDEGLPYRPNGANASATRAHLIDHAVARLYDPNAGNKIALLRFRDGTSRTVVAAELVSGRLLKQICETARQAAFERHASGGAAGLIEQDMQAAVEDAIDRLARLLTRSNAREYLADLPQDNDVVSVDCIERRVQPHRYLYRQAGV